MPDAGILLPSCTPAMCTPGAVEHMANWGMEICHPWRFPRRFQHSMASWSTCPPPARVYSRPIFELTLPKSAYIYMSR